MASAGCPRRTGHTSCTRRGSTFVPDMTTPLPPSYGDDGRDGPGPDMNAVVGHHDLLMVTLDTLRYDVAAELAAAGRLPNLARVLPQARWEARHTPGSFTYAAHT